ncbi:hypothetical protein FHW23_000915 [Curtobacterium pusillum]|uniref:Bacterial Ig domain-containing protein n=1 Tax=Curtobacterium pusillum TaxID=69373 RepID=A0AAW3T3V8_9MICO|nr:hypothetical protein [Curtobacterium pusillum]MBA8989683.1 hypothetical protein [Curtobacterium pusillum]
MVNSPGRRFGGIAFGLAVTASPLLGLPSVAAASADATDGRVVPFVLERANGEHDEKVYYGKGSVSFAKSAIQDRTWDESVGTTMAVTVPERGERGNIRAVDELIAGEAGRCLAVARYTMSWTTEACTPEHDFLRAADGSLRHIGTGEYLTASGSGSAALLYTSVREQDKATFVGDEGRSEVPGRPGFPVAHVAGNKTTITWSAPQVGGKPDLYQIKLDDGAWQGAPGVEASFTFLDVPVGSHKVTLKAQNSSGTSRDWTTVFFVMETAVDEVDGEKGIARVYGRAPGGAEIRVAGDRIATADPSGAWSGEVAADAVRSSEDVRFDSFVSGRLVTSKSIAIDFDGASDRRFELESPAEGGTATRTDGTVEFVGSGQPGAKVNVAYGSELTPTNADAEGRWAVRVKLPAGSVRAVVWYRSADGAETTQHPVQFTVVGDSERPFELESPTAGGTATRTDGLVEFAGSGAPGARVSVAHGSKLSSTNADADGRWKVRAELPAGSVRAAVWYRSADGAETTQHPVQFTVVDGDESGQPFSVTKPGDDGVVELGTSRIDLTGSGADGATVEVQGPGKPVAKTTVADGAWSVPVELVEGDNQLAVRYTAPGAEKPVEQTVPVRLTPYPKSIEVTSDKTYVPGEFVELHGTAEPLSGFVMYDSLYPKGEDTIVRVDKDGNWSWRSVKPSTGTHTVYTATATLGEHGRFPIDLHARNFASEVTITSDPTYTPGEQAVLRGTSEPGKRFLLRFQYGQFADNLTVDVSETGEWEARTRRPVPSGDVEVLITAAKGEVSGTTLTPAG